MSKRSGNGRRSTRSKRRERREEEKEERLLHIFARFSIATIALYRKGNRWISGLIKKFQQSRSLSRRRIQDQIFLREKKSRSQQCRFDRLGLFSFFPFILFPSAFTSAFRRSQKTEKIANLSRRNPLRMADISAGERRRRIWRVLDRSVFSFSPLPLPYEAVE